MGWPGGGQLKGTGRLRDYTLIMCLKMVTSLDSPLCAVRLCVYVYFQLFLQLYCNLKMCSFQHILLCIHAF